MADNFVQGDAGGLRVPAVAQRRRGGAVLHQVVQLLLQRVEEDRVGVHMLQEVLVRGSAVGLELNAAVGPLSNDLLSTTFIDHFVNPVGHVC